MRTEDLRRVIEELLEADAAELSDRPILAGEWSGYKRSEIRRMAKDDSPSPMRISHEGVWQYMHPLLWHDSMWCHVRLVRNHGLRDDSPTEEVRGIREARFRRMERKG